jgi:RND family efflux transporter MFP subunit
MKKAFHRDFSRNGLAVTILLLVLLAAALTACKKAPVEVVEPVARPVKSMVIASPQGAGIRRFPGRVDSANKAELSFRVSGKVKSMLVQEGQRVEKDELLAELDDADYRLALKDSQAAWDRSKKDYDRATELVEGGSISRSDFDRIEARFKSDDAALEQARLNLEYTRLKASFAGTIAKRHVQRFEEVQAKAPIFSLIDESSLLVKFDVPENLILALPSASRQEAVGSSETRVSRVWASFDTAKEMMFPLQFLEAATRADAKTQTFEVTFSLPKPEGLTVLPGMTASVTVNVPELGDGQLIYLVPVHAVSGNETLKPRIWIIDEKTLTVHSREVSIGRVLGSSVEILSGLESGSRIVTAGSNGLAEGMKVRLMQQTEQAELREDAGQREDT